MTDKKRVLSGMRPTGALHLGHYHGALKNWVRLQSEMECFYFVADWHALTTHYENPDVIEASVYEMVIDWLATGIDPEQCTLFLQSRLPEHAELFTLLAMGTPLSWLERVPTYKDQQQQLKDKDLSTYGFLGYPLLQAADILIYKAHYVPVGEDQASHVELTREAARRFNDLYGRRKTDDAKTAALLESLPKEDARYIKSMAKKRTEQGDDTVLAKLPGFLSKFETMGSDDKALLTSFVSGKGKVVLVEPDVLLTNASKLPGLDGRKMSKSYGNAIGIREEAASIEKKVREMPTDPARVKRTDAGNPEKCPVWQFHLVYSDENRKKWVTEGCTTAGIGCIECKKTVSDAILLEQQPMLDRAKPYIANPARVREIVDNGCSRAQAVAKSTMTDVRKAMGLNY
ncbi:tryptophan--tRNA ligase [Variovorax sp. PCZ-1]|uniref:tryptophan--tRNA ligase n=1 Tax=Variovorax sp. PCZ-1 TaxID=2835533 RepID=UPI001BCBD3B4|nr:tryptophan--tRNA ligase [Variovorax sp. PCZ-1]MBS7807951.1 tryptophan--tRNA ligase [Variovorax sp. PCZ-1]